MTPGLTRTPDHRDRLRSCEQVTVTKVVVVEGAGIDIDPVREVTYFYDADGWRIARRDGWEEQQLHGADRGGT